MRGGWRGCGDEVLLLLQPVQVGGVGLHIMEHPLGLCSDGGGREQCPHLGTAMPDVGESGQTQADH